MFKEIMKVIGTILLMLTVAGVATVGILYGSIIFLCGVAVLLASMALYLVFLTLHDILWGY